MICYTELCNITSLRVIKLLPRFISAVLTHGHVGQFAWGPTSIGLRANLHVYICMLCTACFFMFKHRFCWKYKYYKYMFIVYQHLHFYSFKWLCRQSPVHCFTLGPIMLLRQPCLKRAICGIGVYYFIFLSRYKRRLYNTEVQIVNSFSRLLTNVVTLVLHN